MYHYFAYNLQIDSEIELPGYPEIQSLESMNFEFPKIQILAETINSAISDENKSGGDVVFGKAPGILECYIQDGKKIVVDPDPNADKNFVLTVISGELMAALLRQRGSLVLHGACVTNGENTFALVGYSGWGKSTTAAYFINDGYRLLGEDLLVIDLVEPAPMVIPGPQVLKLRPDAGKLFLDDFDDLPKVYKGTNKCIYIDNSAENVQQNPVPLNKIYILEAESRGKNSIIPIPIRDALVELVKHTRNMKLLTGQSFMMEHFKQCSSLLEKIPIGLLQRKRILDSLPEIKSLIEEDLKALKNPVKIAEDV